MTLEQDPRDPILCQAILFDGQSQGTYWGTQGSRENIWETWGEYLPTSIKVFQHFFNWYGHTAVVLNWVWFYPPKDIFVMSGDICDW